MREASTIVALLASAVIVLGGLAATMRVLLHTRDELRDNTSATRANTSQLQQVGGRIDSLELRMARLERRRRKRLRWEYPPTRNHPFLGPGPPLLPKLDGPGHFACNPNLTAL